MVIQGVSYPSDFEAKKLMIETGRRMDEKGYVIGAEGSLSVRVGPNAVWITAEGADKGALKQENFIRVDMNGKQAPGSRNTRLPEDVSVHLGIYSQNPALRGILHGYPAGAVAFAARGCEVTAADYTPSVRKLGRISLIPTGSVEETGRAAALVCKNDSGVLIAGDGCMMWGESLTEAYQKLQAVEYYVKVSSLMGCGNMSAAGCQQPPERAAVVSPAGMPEEIPGLTPLIRPGERAGFQLPAGGDSRPVGAGRPVTTAASGAMAPAAPGPVTAAVGQKSPVQSGAAAPVNGASRREQMMAEVVRRSLASLQ